MAVIVLVFTTPIAPLPRLPDPWIVLALVSTSVVAVAEMRLAALLERVNLPGPPSVRLPVSRSSVFVPVELSVKVPLLVSVPSAWRVWPLLTFRMLPAEIVTGLVDPFRMALFSPTSALPDLLVRVPPEIVAASSSTCDPVPEARMVPPLLV